MPTAADPTGRYAEFHARSQREPEAFWAEQAALIDWQEPWSQVLDASKPPFARWFVGGRTNLCHNAVDRHAAAHPERRALVWISTEVDQEREWNFAELQQEVEAAAAMLKRRGVGRGDRVLIYCPMVPEAAFAMLACARIGAIHSVVFGGFASHSLAGRIEDCSPKLIVSCDAGSRAGKLQAYQPLLEEALRLSQHKVEQVLWIDRGLVPLQPQAGRDFIYASEREAVRGERVPCEWLESNEVSYTLYTSGTTGRPKGVQRDVGGYAVALAASIRHIFDGRPGETFFSTSDIGWVVGHSYIVYGPLIAGMATLMVEGTPLRPDPGIWWRLVQKYQVTVMFSAPTAVRVLRKADPSYLTQSDLSSLRALFLAGEPLDEPTARWIRDALDKPVVDNYWQTETGWPILTLARGVAPMHERLGSPGLPMYGYHALLVDPETGATLEGPNQKGVLALDYPLPPGCLQTVWGDDERFVKTYWSSIPGRQLYSTFDVATRDADGYTFILGRSDDVINVAGHRLGTREIEESIASVAEVAEVAVVGVADELKGQVAVAFVVPKQAMPEDALAAAVMQRVNEQLGAVARPARVLVVQALPKTRSGKLLRRAMQALCEGRELGDLSTLEDAATLQALAERLKPA
ncbi:MAG: propionate--CoA ligase [Inhella sp.]